MDSTSFVVDGLVGEYVDRLGLSNGKMNHSNNLSLIMSNGATVDKSKIPIIAVELHQNYADCSCIIN